MPVRIRTSLASDDAQLAALDARSWPRELQVAPPTAPDEPFFAGRREPDDVVVAVLDDDLVGYAHVARHVPLAINAHVLHLNALVVDERCQGRGIGHQLVEAVIAEARRRGVRKLGLRALSNNARAIRLYEQHGFELEGRLRDEFTRDGGSYVDDLWFALFLT